MNKNKAIALVSVSSAIFGLNVLFNVAPALAHHPNGGEIPSTFTQGLLSGSGHPVIGIDHLVFVIAIGLLAALRPKLGMVIPTAFVVATAVGTIIHLQSVDLPAAELIISASVLVMGIFLAQAKQTNIGILAALGAIAGVFHGYAYGESIVGAETVALGAYMFGFCSIQ
ncbi:MAG: HupE/UreJ family protein [Cyanobacteria bacterium J06600_6]